VAVPHGTLGEALRAFVVPVPGEDVSRSSLLGHARRRLAGYKLPYAIEVVDELPLLPGGKPDRAALQARASI
jgi:acyl-CoA synthetase (AMP-forming)/AMP-acid ligase II